MKRYQKLAIFGGTFSPVHNGHLRAMQAYADAVRPDILYVIPTAGTPRKPRQDTVTDAQRLEMLRLALSDVLISCPVHISDMELRRGGNSYTVDTLTELDALADELFMFCGSDMLLTMENWVRFEELKTLASIVYMQREGDSKHTEMLAEKAAFLTERYGARLIALTASPLEISSGEIRTAVQKGESISSFVPHKVAEYIAIKGLYT